MKSLASLHRAFLCASFSLFALLLGACSPSKPVEQAVLKPLVVESEPAVLTDEALPVNTSGVLSRRLEVTLSFKTGGLIAAIAVRAGDAVSKGQVLARLSLEEIDAQVSQASSSLEKARRDLARVEALHADRVATLENLQDARTGLELASAALRAATFNREHSVITATAPGVILRRLAEPGELAAAGRPILSFAADGEGWIARVAVTESEVLRLHLGDSASVQIGEEQPPVPATVAQIADTTDLATRTVEIELRLSQPPPAGARSGFLIHARLQPRPVPARTAVPLASLIEGRAGSASVFLLSADGHSVKRTPVEVVEISAEKAYLRSPLPEGSRVVTTGAEFLSDGRAVIDSTRKP